MSTPLPMWNEQQYAELLKKLSDKRKSPKTMKTVKPANGKRAEESTAGTDQTPYRQIAGKKGRVLKTLRSAYTNEKFWANYLDGRDPENYHECGWSHFLPVIARIVPDIRFSVPKDAAYKVSVMPRIVLFPTGWCVWLGLQIDGPHSLDDLQALMESVLERHENVFVQDSTTSISLNAFWVLTEDAGNEAFGDVKDPRSNPTTFVMTSVLIGEEEEINIDELGEFEAALQTLVGHDHVADCHIGLQGGPPDRNFFLAHDYNYFLWCEHLLLSDKWSLSDLHCYHSNTVRSLLIHWQERHLLERLDERGWKDEDAHLAALATYAYKQLDSPPTDAKPKRGTIWNKLLKQRLTDPELKDLLKRVPPKFGGPPPPSAPSA